MSTALLKFEDKEAILLARVRELESLLAENDASLEWWKEMWNNVTQLNAAYVSRIGEYRARLAGLGLRLHQPSERNANIALQYAAEGVRFLKFTEHGGKLYMDEVRRVVQTLTEALISLAAEL